MRLLMLLAALAAPPAAASDPAEKAMWEVLGHFDTFPGADPYAVADTLEMAGASFHTAGFATTSSPDQVLAFYRAEFDREGLKVFGQPAQTKDFQGLSAFDPKTKLEKTVIVLPGFGGPTRVVLSIADGRMLRRAAEGKTTLDQTAGFPVPPDVKPLRSDAVDGARRTTTISYRAQLDPAALANWLRPEFATQGWTEEAPGDDSDGKALRFRRGGEALEVLLVGTKASTEVTYLHLH